MVQGAQASQWYLIGLLGGPKELLTEDHVVMKLNAKCLHSAHMQEGENPKHAPQKLNMAVGLRFQKSNKTAMRSNQHPPDPTGSSAALSPQMTKLYLDMSIARKFPI